MPSTPPAARSPHSARASRSRARSREEHLDSRDPTPHSWRQSSIELLSHLTPSPIMRRIGSSGLDGSHHHREVDPAAAAAAAAEEADEAEHDDEIVSGHLISTALAARAMRGRLSEASDAVMHGLPPVSRQPTPHTMGSALTSEMPLVSQSRSAAVSRASSSHALNTLHGMAPEAARVRALSRSHSASPQLGALHDESAKPSLPPLSAAGSHPGMYPMSSSSQSSGRSSPALRPRSERNSREPTLPAPLEAGDESASGDASADGGLARVANNGSADGYVKAGGSEARDALAPTIPGAGTCALADSMERLAAHTIGPSAAGDVGPLPVGAARASGVDDEIEDEQLAAEEASLHVEEGLLDGCQGEEGSASAVSRAWLTEAERIAAESADGSPIMGPVTSGVAPEAIDLGMPKPVPAHMRLQRSATMTAGAPGMGEPSAGGSIVPELRPVRSRSADNLDGGARGVRGKAAPAEGRCSMVGSKTYEVQQEMAAARKILQLHEHKGLGILDRLERVRRGHGRRSTITHSTAPSAHAAQHAPAASPSAAAESGRSTWEVPDADADADGGSSAKARSDTRTSTREGRMSSRFSRLSWAGVQRLSGRARGLSGKLAAGPVIEDDKGFESYQFEVDESRVHFELRAARSSRYQLSVLYYSFCFVLAIGVTLGCIAAAITLVESFIIAGRNGLTRSIMWPCDSTGCDDEQTPSTGMMWAAYGGYIGINTLLILGAALFVYWEPQAAASGLPPLKAFLNGVNVPGLLDWSTLAAKTIGITLVVATGLPLGREGPMVHTGAIVAARLTRNKLTTNMPIDIRLPSAQRNWVGMGCAAGVAAAFNSPLGGILYSFEEVCSHWSNKMTWRSFFCVIVSAIVFNVLIQAFQDNIDQGGILLQQGLVLGLLESAKTTKFEYYEFFFFACIGAIGGIIGALYITVIVRLNSQRRRFLSQRKALKVVEACLWASIVFSVYFWLPLGFECKNCELGMDCYNGTSGSGSGSGSVAGRRLAGGGSTLLYEQWNCPKYQFNTMATLLHSGQEGLIKHLLARSADTAIDSDPTLHAAILGPLLAIHFVLASTVFGIAVPAGNFIPAFTIGAMSGRLFGTLLNQAGIAVDPGLYALMGSAAVLGGVTRMTLTLAVILVEVTNDALAMLPMMLVVAVAKAVGDLFSPSFDDAMMHLMQLPYLEEEPPHEFDVLTARDVMARSVVVLREVERVGDLVAVINRTRHNGFPVVDLGKHQRCTFFSGLILRRQLIVLLRERVWELQERGDVLPADACSRYVDSAFVKGGKGKLPKLSEAEKAMHLDLRPFMDPSPYVVNELMPLRRVYRLFNEIGVRHLTVVDCREQVVGIVTRKDVLPEQIEERVMAEDNLEEVVKLLHQASTERRGSTPMAAAAALGGLLSSGASVVRRGSQKGLMALTPTAKRTASRRGDEDTTTPAGSVPNSPPLGATQPSLLAAAEPSASQGINITSSPVVATARARRAEGRAEGNVIIKCEGGLLSSTSSKSNAGPPTTQAPYRPSNLSVSSTGGPSTRASNLEGRLSAAAPASAPPGSNACGRVGRTASIAEVSERSEEPEEEDDEGAPSSTA